MSNALRYNEGKPDLHYLHTWYNALCEVSEICMAGAKKYARGNYLKGQPMSQLLACAERHIMKFGSPKYSDYDEETKKHHLAHAIWNLLQALENDLTPEMKEKFDDRLRVPDEKKENKDDISVQAGAAYSRPTYSDKREIPVRTTENSVSKEDKCVYTGLCSAERDHSGDEGAFRSFRSSEAFARKGTES